MTTWTAFTTLAVASARRGAGARLSKPLEPAPDGSRRRLRDRGRRGPLGGRRLFHDRPRRDRAGAFCGGPWRGGIRRLKASRDRLGRQGPPRSRPVVAGRFFVYGSHDADRVPDGSVPASHRGGDGLRHRPSGHHPGLPSRARCARLGGGPPRAHRRHRLRHRGFLAMAAKRVFPGAEVHASDIDAVAIEVAEANLAANAMAGAVEDPCRGRLRAPGAARRGALRPRLRQYPEGPPSSTSPPTWPRFSRPARG